MNSSISPKHLSSSQFLTTRNLHYSFKEEIIQAYTIYKKKLCKNLSCNTFSVFNIVILMKYVVIQLSQIYLTTFFFTLREVNPYKTKSSLFKTVKLLVLINQNRKIISTRIL